MIVLDAFVLDAFVDCWDEIHQHYNSAILVFDFHFFNEKLY
jgi:hypothetical protein